LSEQTHSNQKTDSLKRIGYVKHLLAVPEPALCDAVDKRIEAIEAMLFERVYTWLVRLHAATVEHFIMMQMQRERFEVFIRVLDELEHVVFDRGRGADEESRSVYDFFPTRL